MSVSSTSGAAALQALVTALSHDGRGIARFPDFHAERLVYVSCHPATLARDAKLLVEDQGWYFARAGVLDMYPHTAHVESIAVFTRR